LVPGGGGAGAGSAHDDTDDAVEVTFPPSHSRPYAKKSRQWARNRRREEDERDGDFGPEDDFDGALRNGGDAGDTETLILFALVAAVLVLMVVRARIAERLRREAARQPGGPAPPQPGQAPRPPGDADAGLFPGPNDPARQDWAVLR
jgi:SEL1 protein